MFIKLFFGQTILTTEGTVWLRANKLALTGYHRRNDTRLGYTILYYTRVE